MQAITAIGISQDTTLECTPHDLNTSESGLYLDELPGLGSDWFAPDGDYGQCADPKSYLQRLIKARVEAHSLTHKAIIKGLGVEHTIQKHTFAGALGQKTGTGAATGNTFVIKSNSHTDAVLAISQVGVVSSGTGTVTVTLTYPGSIAEVFEIEVSGSGYHFVPASLRLPLDGTEYTFEATSSEGVSLQRNTIGCGCGAKDTDMLKYMGFTGSTANGISLSAAVKCDVKDFYNRVYTENEDVQSVLARMLFYRAGVVLCDYIMGQSQPDVSDTNLEYIKARRDNFLSEFNERLAWLMESGIDVTGSACFKCYGARIHTIG